jgi:enoyl-CoA hydratase
LAKLVIQAGFETDQQTGFILEKMAQSLLYYFYR